MQARLRVPAAFRQRLGAVAHDLTAVENAADERVPLEMLEGGMGIEQRVLVVEADHEANGEPALGHRVQPAAAELLVAQWVAERVDDGARRQPILRNVPELLDAEGKLRRLGFAAQLQGLHQLLGQVAADAIRENRHLGVDVGAELDGALGLAVLADAAVARAHANHPGAVVEHVLAGKAHEQVDAFGLDLPRQPLRELVERDDVVAVILERRRRDRQPQLLPGRQEVDVVLVHFRRQRRALGLEIRDEVAQRGRVEQGARELMPAGVAGLFDHRDRQRLPALLLVQLREAQGRGQAGRPAPDNQDVYFEGLALSHSRYSSPKPQAFCNSAIMAGASSNRSPWMP